MQEAITIPLSNSQNMLEIFLELSKNKLVNIIKYANKARKEKYQDHKPALYGNLPRAYSKKNLLKFFKGVKMRETRKIFLIQYFYALRIGELYELEYMPQQQLLKIHNQKADRTDYLPVHGETYKLFEKPLRLPHIDNLRKTFNKTNHRLGLEYIYHRGKTGGLRQYTPHSLRHTAITTFLNHIQNPLKAMHYSRHQSREYGSLPTYYYYSMDDMRTDLEEAFKPYYELIS